MTLHSKQQQHHQNKNFLQIPNCSFPTTNPASLIEDTDDPDDTTNNHDLLLLNKTTTTPNTDLTTNTRRFCSWMRCYIERWFTNNTTNEKIDKSTSAKKPSSRSKTSRNHRSKRVTRRTRSEGLKKSGGKVDAICELASMFSAPILKRDGLMERFLYATREQFEGALEVFNRRAIRPILTEGKQVTCQNSWYCEFYWECKGKVKAGQQLCIMCRDVGKEISFLEKYYVDTMEMKRERSILCHGCMGRTLREEVGEDFEQITEELHSLREEQSVLTCGDL